MKSLSFPSFVVALFAAQSVYASETSEESWFRFISAAKAARTEEGQVAALAFENVGTSPRVFSAARYNPTGSVSWSPGARFLAISTYETDDTMSVSDPPGAWILDGLDGEPLYYREGTFIDVALVGEAHALLTVTAGSPRKVEWTSLRDAGLPSAVGLPDHFEAESVSVSSGGSAFAIRSGKATCVGRSDSPANPACFPFALHRAALSHDGSKLLGTEGRSFTVRDATTGRLIVRQSSEVNSPLAISGDGHRVAYMRAGKLVVAHAETGKTISEFKVIQSSDEEWGPATVIALDFSGKRVALLDSMGQLRVNGSEGKLLFQLLVSYGVSHFEEQNNGPLAFAPDGDHLHAGNVVVSISEGERVPDGAKDEPAIGGRSELRFSSDGTQVGSEHFYYSLVENRESTKEDFDSADRLVEASADGRFRISWSKDGKSLVLDDALRPERRPVLWKRPTNGGTPVTRLLPDRVTLLLVSESESGRGETILLIDLRTGEVSQEIEALSGCRTGTMDLSETGRNVVVECTGKPYLWDFVSARPTKLSDDYVEGLSFAGPRQAVFTEKGGRVLLDVDSRERRLLSPPTAGLNCRGQAVDGKSVTCHEDGLRVWNRAVEVAKIHAKAEDVNFWDFAPKNQVVLHFGDRIEIHSLEKKKLVATLHHRILTAPDGAFQVVGDVPDLRCRYGNYVLPFEACSARHENTSLLKQIFR